MRDRLLEVDEGVDFTNNPGAELLRDRNTFFNDLCSEVGIVPAVLIPALCLWSLAIILCHVGEIVNDLRYDKSKLNGCEN
jgi:hypothetical protein